ncbi:hypothetical protein CWI42_060160 [Ordospora colligata]|uniref:Uncharacterized protein n=1 Tax=Ordospora colligata OC4 TaxID=1354746 RepID=A0A0B2UJJ0_9MICR|nr:uncharacterized protein M896_060160 [Ordospora colligata OC4]KHN69518.1 hypothetical protein M896_060160 [Ordospora colligata OC4]TBU15338.1 hypothetical protein CWI41_060150 [Ordospora colligata]TBU15438.1 hypothetical protein CWI40_060150 [Ordospora colligata]TBU18534.1 hypothetical protein CWI42_060160 [Ordospora colligata]
MQSVLEYVKNIDLETVTDPEVLNNVYQEINGFEKELVSNSQTTYQMESIVKKSNVQQVTDLLKKLDVDSLSKKKLGSRFIEVICDVVFKAIYIKKLQVDTVTLFSLLNTKDAFQKNFLNTNATHVIRKLFQIACGKKIVEGRIEQRFDPLMPGHLEKLKDAVLELIPSMTKEDSFVTLLMYLHCYRSQTVIYEVSKHHFSLESICNPNTSYFFEKIVQAANKKTLKMFFDAVAGNEMNLCRDKYGNYFIGELILHYSKKADHFFLKLQRNEFDKNSNITMKLAQALAKQKSYTNLDQVVNTFYLENKSDDILFNTFGGVEGNFKQKYAPMLCELMKLPDGHNYSVNSAFKTRFCASWIRSKGGMEMLKGYYEGTDCNKSKKEFTRKIQKYLPDIMDRKGSESVIKLIMRYKSRSE